MVFYQKCPCLTIETGKKVTGRVVYPACLFLFGFELQYADFPAGLDHVDVLDQGGVQSLDGVAGSVESCCDLRQCVTEHDAVERHAVLSPGRACGCAAGYFVQFFLIDDLAHGFNLLFKIIILVYFVNRIVHLLFTCTVYHTFCHNTVTQKI